MKLSIFWSHSVFLGCSMFFNPFKTLHPQLGFSLTSAIWSAYVHCDLSKNSMCAAGEDQDGRERFVAVILSLRPSK